MEIRVYAFMCLFNVLICLALVMPGATYKSQVKEIPCDLLHHYLNYLNWITAKLKQDQMMQVDCICVELVKKRRRKK